MNHLYICMYLLANDRAGPVEYMDLMTKDRSFFEGASYHATHCNKLQHTATHTATHCNTLQHTTFI